MNGPRKSAVLVAALVGLAACGPSGWNYRNPLDGNEYRVLTAWPLLCHPDGSVIFVQKVNLAGGFTEASETPQPCVPIADQKRAPDPGHGAGVDVPEAAAEAPGGGFGGGFGGSGMF